MTDTEYKPLIAVSQVRIGSTPSRRGFLAFTAGASALATLPVPALAMTPDAELIALCAEFCVIEQRIDARFDTIADDDEREAASEADLDRQDELLDRILEG